MKMVAFVFSWCRSPLIKYPFFKNLQDITTKTHDTVKEKSFSDFESRDECKELYTNHGSLAFIFTVIDWKSIICSRLRFSKKKKCVHVYMKLKDENTLNLINITLLISRSDRGRKKKVVLSTNLLKGAV